MIIGGYELMDEIGSGGFADVYKCKKISDGSIKAIKIADLNDDNEKIRFKREIRMQSSLTHKNIVPILDYNTVEEPFFYTMPLGKMNLERYIEKVSVEEEKIEIFKDIAEGLKYAHKKVVHRDLKPGNIIIFCEDGVATPKICDFGLGKFSIRDSTILTKTSHYVGTPYYIAPEQLDNPKTVDKRSDIYALGKILYIMITGENVYSYDISKIPSEYRYIITKACERNPDDRYQDVDELLKDLDQRLPKDPLKLINEEIEKIVDSNDYSKFQTEFLAKILSQNSIHDEILLMLPNIPKKILKSLLDNHKELFFIVLTDYDDSVKGEVNYNYCDVVADFYCEIFKLSESLEVRSLIINRLAKLGAHHNRYHVGQTFSRIVNSNNNNIEIMLMAKKALESKETREFNYGYLTDKSIKILERI
jgi:serine/threonine protein kinase